MFAQGMKMFAIALSLQPKKAAKPKALAPQLSEPRSQEELRLEIEQLRFEESIHEELQMMRYRRYGAHEML
jgi:hypothetical protein